MENNKIKFLEETIKTLSIIDEKEIEKNRLVKLQQYNKAGYIFDEIETLKLKLPPYSELVRDYLTHLNK